MKRYVTWYGALFLTGVYAGAAWVSSPRVAAQNPATQTVIPIEGLDPVALSQGTETQGKEGIFVVRGRFKYIFASEANKAAFEKDPQRYEIAGDYCHRMGPATDANPDLYAVHDGRIYLFGSEGCVKAFKAAPADYLEPAMPAWSATAEQTQRGRALLEKAVEALGGARRVDGLTSYRERQSGKRQTRQGEIDVSTELTQAFPGSLRLVENMPFGKITTVVTAGQQFGIFTRTDGRSNEFPVGDGDRLVAEQRLLRNPLLLLRRRGAASFRAAAVGAEKAGPAAVELVATEADQVRITLGVDSASGRIVSAALVARVGDGKFGKLKLHFSDFRPAGELTLPFRVDATVNGEPFPELSYTVTEIEVNKPVDPSLFEKPKLAGN